MSSASSKLHFLLRRLQNRLWVRAALYGLAGVVSALVAAVVSPYLSLGRAEWLGANAVKDLLTILASSMLAVATFSLSTMVSAFATASGSTTPRASTLLIEDKTAQRALATFIGAFLFSIVGLIALSTGLYGPEGRVVMFGVTVVVIGLVVFTLMRWIGQLADFGRVAETILRVERAAAAAIRDGNGLWGFGAASPGPDRSASSVAIPAARTGFLQHVDTGRLQALAETHQLRVEICLAPGAFTDPRRALAQVQGAVTEDVAEALRAAFTIGKQRTFEQDPRFGLIVLSEIASRALSPAVNDPGTAINVLDSQARLLLQIAELRGGADAGVGRTSCSRLSLPTIAIDDLFIDAFRPIARDGAAMIEVGLRLLRVLDAVARSGDEDMARAACHIAVQSLKRFGAGLTSEDDREVLRAAFASAFPPSAETVSR